MVSPSAAGRSVAFAGKFADGATGADPLPARQAFTNSGLICGRGFAADRGCAVPCTIGLKQASNSQSRAPPPGTNPAFWHMVLICSHAARSARMGEAEETRVNPDDQQNRIK